MVNGPTQELEDTLTAEKLYPIKFTKENRKFRLSLHYNGAHSCLIVNGTDIIKFKAKDYDITAYPLCFGNISKYWSVDEKTWLKSYVCDFRVDYNAIATSDILDIHKYWMKNERA